MHRRGREEGSDWVKGSDLRGEERGLEEDEDPANPTDGAPSSELQ